MKTCYNAVLLLCAVTGLGQPYVEGGRTRHRFAQLNLGADVRLFGHGNLNAASLHLQNITQAQWPPSHTESRLIIGGTHFWGHADFQVAFTLVKNKKSGISNGAETALRFFPWQISDHKLRPYFSLSWLPQTSKVGEGANKLRHLFPTGVGMIYNRKNNLFEAGLTYNYQSRNSYYVSKTQQSTLILPQVWLHIGYKFMLETTLSAESSWKSGRSARLTDTLASLRRLNGFTFAAGMSSAVFLSSPAYNSKLRPYLGGHGMSVFPELGAGYYFHNADLQLNLAYRNINSSIAAYGDEQIIGRRAMSFEAFKFLCDYHGFAAFAGAAAGVDWLKVTEKSDNGEVVTTNRKAIQPGLVFGWDIRPDRLQTWYLRTNLRWYPFTGIYMQNGDWYSFAQLEFNFIQLVVFPGRLF